MQGMRSEPAVGADYSARQYTIENFNPYSVVSTETDTTYRDLIRGEFDYVVLPDKELLDASGEESKRRLSDLKSLGIPKQQRLLAEHIPPQSIPRSLMGFFFGGFPS